VRADRQETRPAVYYVRWDRSGLICRCTSGTCSGLFPLFFFNVSPTSSPDFPGPSFTVPLRPSLSFPLFSSSSLLRLSFLLPISFFLSSSSLPASFFPSLPSFAFLFLPLLFLSFLFFSSSYPCCSLLFLLAIVFFTPSSPSFALFFPASFPLVAPGGAALLVCLVACRPAAPAHLTDPHTCMNKGCSP